jgi:hypothetical protein
MLRKIRRRISPAAVISIIALFAALGGGYATAFSGSGTLQKENEIGLPSDGTTYETIRSLTGIGSIQATCSGSNPPSVKVRLRNTSGEALRAFVDEGDGGQNPETLSDAGVANNTNEAGHPANQSNGLGRLSYHIWPDDGSKRPQANVAVSVYAPSTCSAAQVAVLALNTEE